MRRSVCRRASSEVKIPTTYDNRVSIVCIGDVGTTDAMFHVGDEAMFEQLVRELGSREHTDLVGLSSNVTDTEQRYSIRAISPVGYAGLTRPEQEERMRRVLASAQGELDELQHADPARAVIEAIRASNGVAIAGGGNMSTLWPLHVYERATLGALAALFRKPLIVSGQTLGPQLDDRDYELVAGLLNSARVVGLREPKSYAVAAGMGVADSVRQLTIDDASLLPGIPSTAERPYCLVTLARHLADHDRDHFLTDAAALLDGLAPELDIVFSAHFGPLDGGPSRGDELVHDDVIARMVTPSRIARIVDSSVSAGLARGASLVVTSRYHPAVFAVSAGVPVLAIAVDDYTTTKLTGALGNFGQSGVVQVQHLADAGALASTLLASTPGAPESTIADSDAWFDRISAALS